MGLRESARVDVPGVEQEAPLIFLPPLIDEGREIRDAADELDLGVPERLDWLIERAVARYKKPATWRDTVEHGMALDYSWERVVDRYFEVYEQAFEARAESLADQTA